MTRIPLGSVAVNSGVLKTKTRLASEQFEKASQTHSTMRADFDAYIILIKHGVFESQEKAVILAHLMGDKNLRPHLIKNNYSIMCNDPHQASDGVNLLNALGVQATIDENDAELVKVVKKDFDTLHSRFKNLRGEKLENETTNFKQERLDANDEVWSKKLTELKEKWEKALEAEVSWVKKLETTPTPAKTQTRPRN